LDYYLILGNKKTDVMKLGTFRRTAREPVQSEKLDSKDVVRMRCRAELLETKVLKAWVPLSIKYEILSLTLWTVSQQPSIGMGKYVIASDSQLSTAEKACEGEVLSTRMNDIV
jgi:hypothetical protein